MRTKVIAVELLVQFGHAPYSILINSLLYCVSAVRTCPSLTRHASFTWPFSRRKQAARSTSDLFKCRLKAWLALLLMLAAVVQLNSVLYNATTAVIRRKRAVIGALSERFNGWRVQRRYQPSRADVWKPSLWLLGWRWTFLFLLILKKLLWKSQRNCKQTKA